MPTTTNASSQRRTTLTLDEQIDALKRWLGPSTLRNTWTMRDAQGFTVIHVYRMQHFKHVLRKARQNHFPVMAESKQVIKLQWLDCVNCGFKGDAHSPQRKCLFGASVFRDVPIQSTPATGLDLDSEDYGI